MQQVVIARIIHLSHPDVAARASHSFEAMPVFPVVAENKKREKEIKKNPPKSDLEIKD